MGRLTNIEDVRVMLLEIVGFCQEMEVMFSENPFLTPSHIAVADATVSNAHKDLRYLSKLVAKYLEEDA